MSVSIVAYLGSNFVHITTFGRVWIISMYHRCTLFNRYVLQITMSGEQIVSMDTRLPQIQGQYLAFIHFYTKINEGLLLS